MPRYQIIIEYDGGSYSGWQLQEGKPTIQGELEAAAARLCGEPTAVQGAGRTDAGVHATAQAAHIDLPKAMEPYNLMQGLNFHLFNRKDSEGKLQPVPSNRIAVTYAKLVSDTFHARFSAVKRHYLYRIINRRARLGLDQGRAWQIPEKLDINAMQDGSQYLIGHHDFSSFRDSMCQARSPEKTLDMLNISANGAEIHITTSARSFLHHQVRIMVGSLVLVGKGRWNAEDIRTALEHKRREAAGPTAPPDGLYLTGVEY